MLVFFFFLVWQWNCIRCHGNGLCSRFEVSPHMSCCYVIPLQLRIQSCLSYFPNSHWKSPLQKGEKKMYSLTAPDMGLWRHSRAVGGQAWLSDLLLGSQYYCESNNIKRQTIFKCPRCGRGRGALIWLKATPSFIPAKESISVKGTKGGQTQGGGVYIGAHLHAAVCRFQDHKGQSKAA